MRLLQQPRTSESYLEEEAMLQLSLPNKRILMVTDRTVAAKT